MTASLAVPVPLEIQESLAKFRTDYPDPMRVAFLMMQFGTTTAHNRIVRAIRESFSKYDIGVLRADDKQYHDDLLPNVKTYMHGCGFGIALFERLVDEDFNPNASLEIGYMMAMGKDILLLKDQTLKALNTDLVGRLYKSFDAQNPEGTVPAQVSKWLDDKGLSKGRPRHPGQMEMMGTPAVLQHEREER